MKMLKKIMSILLVSVLALTVLTGCGAAAVDENELLNMMNDNAKAQSLGTTYKADSNTRTKAQAVAKLAAKAKNSAELDKLLASDDVKNTLLNNDTAGMYMVSYIKPQNFASKYYQSQKDYLMLNQMAEKAQFALGKDATSTTSTTALVGFASMSLSDGAYTIIVIKIA